MRILVIGGGGREHALAWKLAQSPAVKRVYVSPGNGGTADAGAQVSGAPIANLPAGRSFAELIAAAHAEGIGLAVVGPEAELASGIVDALKTAGIPCFGPSAAAAELESSKAFAKAFMVRHGIPTARFAVFSSHDRALAHLRAVDYPVVIKASGLAAGKGVIVPADTGEAIAALGQIMLDRAFGAAGDEVVIEERLTGPEVSVLAFCDGETVALMPAAQDHKRVFDHDRGPNTGGMGAYAPTPLATPALMDEVQRTVLQPAAAGLAAEGRPYLGILYAGLMLTPAGMRVLEFNCRFGDPETQVILPLLESDLAAIFLACLEGRLGGVAPTIRWRAGAAATVVAASGGYPGSYRRGLPIDGVAEAAALPGVTVFQAGTRLSAEGRLLTDGGRVLDVTGVGANLRHALDRAYAGIDCIHFPDMHYRRDIGAAALALPVQGQEG
jgi:phosphoribosylamine--glycine ligase